MEARATIADPVRAGSGASAVDGRAVKNALAPTRAQVAAYRAGWRTS